jgi:hypothetical protein
VLTRLTVQRSDPSHFQGCMQAARGTPLEIFPGFYLYEEALYFI